MSAQCLVMNTEEKPFDQTLNSPKSDAFFIKYLKRRSRDTINNFICGLRALIILEKRLIYS